MGGEERILYDASKPFGGFKPPVIKSRWLTPIYMGAFWLYVFYRFKQDGPHHYLRHHPWEDSNVIEYLEDVDKRYGTSYSINNIGYHDTKGVFRVAQVPSPEQQLKDRTIDNHHHH